MTKEIKLKINYICSVGNSCNFCVTPSGLTTNVNEIQGHQLVIRICDDCFNEFVRQKELQKKKVKYESK